MTVEVEMDAARGSTIANVVVAWSKLVEAVVVAVVTVVVVPVMVVVAVDVVVVA